MEMVDHNDLTFKIQDYKKGLKSDIENLIIKNYTFGNIKFEYTGLGRNIFENCVFENVLFYDVYVSESIFKKCIFRNCEFVAIDFGMSEVVFEDTIIYKTNFNKTDSLSSSFVRTCFLNCNFIYFDVSKNSFYDCRMIECNTSGLIYSPGDFNSNNIFIPELKSV